jgi:hypothetical protein
MQCARAISSSAHIFFTSCVQHDDGTLGRNVKLKPINVCVLAGFIAIVMAES